MENPMVGSRAKAWLGAVVLMTVSFVAALWLALLWGDWRFVWFALWWGIVLLVLVSATYPKRR